MLVQKELEEKITTALTASLASVSGVAVAGAWATAQTGLVKWIEGAAESPAFVSVSVACPDWQTLTTPVVNFACNITLFIRPEIDTTGALLVSAAEKIEDTLRGWQLATGGVFTALDTTNLSVDGVSLGGGTAPTITNNVCNVTWNFTLSGSYRETAT